MIEIKSWMSERNQLSESKDESRASIPAVITTAISLAGFAIFFATQSSQLPVLAQFAVASIIIALGVLFGVWIWYRPLSSWNKRWRRNRIARRHFSQLIIFSERLGEFIRGSSSMSNAQYFLLQLKGRAKEFGAIQIPSPSYPQQLSMDLEKGLKMQKRNLRTFVWGADSLDSLIRFFDEAYLLGPVKEVHAIVNKLKETEASDDVPDVPADIRDGFNSMRGMIVRFLQDYELFVTQVSKELGKYRIKVMGDWQSWDYLRGTHFEPPPELPGPLPTF